MPLKSLVFGGAAVAALCGLMAAPVMADPTGAASSPATATDTAQPAAQAAAPLASIANPSQKLANADVVTSDGQKVGAVKKVVVDPTGMAKAVHVTLTDGTKKTVAIQATQLNFDQNKNVLISTMTVDQINALPSASST